MIPTREEAKRSLLGAWRLFLDRADGMRLLDVSLDGFWRSFGAIWLVLPSYLVTVMVERRIRLAEPFANEAFDDVAFLSAKTVAVLTDWVAMPILLAVAARPLGIAQTYVGYIVARNWATVIAMVPYALASLLVGFGGALGEFASILSLAVLIIVLRYQYLVVRHALQVGIGFAIGFVIADFLLSLLIGEGIDQMFGL